MHILQIRNIPEELFEKIKLSAKKSRRSLTQEVIVLLDFALSPETDSEYLVRKYSTQEGISQNRKLTKEEADLAVQWIREDRDR